MAKVIGIDLGTTMSAMAYVNDVGKPEIIPNSEGERLTPSAVRIRGGERIVGRKAKNSAVADPENVFRFIKRYMSDPKHVFKDEKGQQHRPEDFSALILKKLKQDAEKALGEEVKQAVITVPAYFQDLARQRTKQAGEIAGFEVLDIINEPTAAAIAYGLKQTQENLTILVYDLGGGTFDVTLMRVEGLGELTVLSSDGDPLLGGKDFDEAICSFFAEQFQAKHQVNPLESRQTYQDFLLKAESAKIDLSGDVEAQVNLTAEGKMLNLDLTLKHLEELISPWILKTQGLTEDVLSDAKLDWGKVDKVLLVGGSTRIPLSQKMLKELTGKEPEIGINPDEVVALGAAVYAAGLREIPVRGAGGKAIATLKIRNVTAHSLGIITTNDQRKEINSKLILKNTQIPAEGDDIFTTVEDNQTEVRIQIIQGEDENPEYCTKVGDAAVLKGIPPQPKGKPEIKVWLSYDQSGIVHLRAEDLGSGSKLSTEIENKALLSGEELKKATAELAALRVI